MSVPRYPCNVADELRYLVAATPRSGSNMLAEALTSIGTVGAPQEWFARPLVHHYLGDLGIRAPESTPDRPVTAAWEHYLEWVRSQATRDGVLAYNVHWNQVEWFAGSTVGRSVFEPFGRLRDVRVLHIWREDIVAQATSSVIADATKVYRQVSAADHGPTFEFAGVPTSEPEYDFRLLLARVLRIAEDDLRWTEFISEHGLPEHLIRYEDLADDLDGVVAAAVRHLGRDKPRPVVVEQVRQRTELNDEFCQRFRADLVESGVSGLLSPELAIRLNGTRV